MSENKPEFELGLIGYPLGHSFSAAYFNDKFHREGIRGRYRLYPIPRISELPHLISEHRELIGLNVTIPYKESVIEYVDTLSDAARAIGAVNVIGIDRRAERPLLKGYNSDWSGFKSSVEPFLTPGMTHALILGTGGAAKAINYALRQFGIIPTYVSRNPQRASTEHQTCMETHCIAYDELTRSVVERNLLIVNATPVGMYPDTEASPEFPYEYLSDRHLCYDLIYNPETTGFMRDAGRYGARVKNGLEMLHRQADRAWEIWQSEITTGIERVP